MDDYETGKSQFMELLAAERAAGAKTAIVSLGDLGESKSVRPDETNELFSGAQASPISRAYATHLSPHTCHRLIFPSPLIGAHLHE
jgi:hypothetical protein|tara:strand:- start:1067 stop:1324 length:258 start_codon:yes stop_codon:yes gene_type:complete